MSICVDLVTILCFIIFGLHWYYIYVSKTYYIIKDELQAQSSGLIRATVITRPWRIVLTYYSIILLHYIILQRYLPFPSSDVKCK